MKSEIIDKAKAFARKAHRGTQRKFTGTPYYEHPKAVAKIVEAYKTSKNLDLLIAAAYLHDTVEDCNISIEEIEAKFGSFIASLIAELTSDTLSVSSYGKSQYLTYKMLTMSNYALVIKLADRYHNVSELDNADINFRLNYVNETNTILVILLKFRKLTKTQEILANEICTTMANLDKKTSIISKK